MNAITVHEHNVSDIERMARAIATSKLFGVQTAEQAIALCLIAQAEGRHPASAAQDYHIISGRPSKKADAMLRDFINSGGKVEWHTLDDATADATFSHPSGGKVRISWDMARAKKAGIKNPMWDKYPRQMLRARTVSEGVRTVYPMATSGMYVPEEVQEFDNVPASKPAASTAPAPEPQASIATPAPASDIYAKCETSIRQAKTVEALNAAWDAVKAVPEDQLPEDQFKALGRVADDRENEIKSGARITQKVAPSFDADDPFSDAVAA